MFWRFLSLFTPSYLYRTICNLKQEIRTLMNGFYTVRKKISICKYKAFRNQSQDIANFEVLLRNLISSDSIILKYFFD